MGEQGLEAINAELQKELNKENEKYYSNLLIYVRVKTMIRGNNKAEELLLEILQDMLEAQKNGISAEAYFGKNPKQIADDIINSLPINILDTFKLLLIGGCSYLLFAFFPAMISPKKSIDIGKYLIAGAFTIVFAMMVLWLFGFTLYRYQSKMSQILFVLFLVAGFIGGFSILSFVSTPLNVVMSNTAGIVLIMAVALVITILFYKEKDKGPWLPFIPILIALAIGGILLRVGSFADLLHTEQGKTIFGIVLIIAAGIQYLIMFIMNKRSVR